MLRKIRISRSDFWVSSHDSLSDFYTSAWQYETSPIPMLLVRLVLVIAGLGILLWSLISGQSGSGANPYWLIYLTNWGLMLVAAMTLSGLFVSANAAYKKIDDDAQSPWYIGLYWLIFNVTLTIAIAITVLYWTLLYNPDRMVYRSQEAFWLDVSTHGFNSVIAVAELLIGRTPVRWLHVYQPLCVAIVYVAFSGIYFAVDGTNGMGDPFIYPVLNWSNPGPAAVVAASSVGGVLVLFTALWLVAKGRNKLAAALVGRRSRDLPTTAKKPSEH